MRNASTFKRIRIIHERNLKGRGYIQSVVGGGFLGPSNQAMKRHWIPLIQFKGPRGLIKKGASSLNALDTVPQKYKPTILSEKEIEAVSVRFNLKLIKSKSGIFII